MSKEGSVGDIANATSKLHDTVLYYAGVARKKPTCNKN
jgi:hypothetical protein